MKIPSPAEQRQTYLAELQPHVDGPILAIGFLGTAGAAAGMVGDIVKGKAIGALSPILGRLFRRNKAQARAKVTRNDLVAVTATSVFLFEFPAAAQPFRVSAPPTVWPRAGLRVTADPKGRLSQRIHVHVASGEDLEYDINAGHGDWGTFSDGMRDLLLEAAPAPT